MNCSIRYWTYPSSTLVCSLSASRNSRSITCSNGSRPPSRPLRAKMVCDCAWYRVGPGSAATSSCSNASCSIWSPTPCATPSEVESWSAAGTAMAVYASTSATAGSASPRISAAISSVSSISSTAERRTAAAGLVSAWPSSIAYVVSLIIGSNSLRALEGGRASQFWYLRRLRGRRKLLWTYRGLLSIQSVGKLVMVIDDNELVRDGTRGLLKSWGCLVVTAESEDAAMAKLAEHGRRPDLIISDYHLAQR